MEDLTALISQLRRGGGDTTSVEIKSAEGGLPTSLLSTLSAMANLPGGGTIILGLDERAGFRSVPLRDSQQLKQGLASQARALTPPVSLTISDATVDGSTVIVAHVSECDPSDKPCRVTSTGAAYLRNYDGDFRLSTLEEQAFLASRKPPMNDRMPVQDATHDDLSPELIREYLGMAREYDPHGLGRFADDTELLVHGGVIHQNGTPTTAGILALGAHPQQWFPRYVIQAAAEAHTPGSRARNQTVITGPIPHMLDAAQAWARRTFESNIITSLSGRVHDQLEYPMAAFRELIVNAMIHRDLSDWSIGMAIEVRLKKDMLVVSNPGGLYGITVERLGQDAVTSARNPRLVDICQYIRSPHSGRVVEALASGIPIIAEALRDADLPPAQFYDTGLRFTALLRSSSAALPKLTITESRVYDALADNSLTVRQLEEILDADGAAIRNTLRRLRKVGIVTQHGGRGKRTTYSHAGRE